MRVLLDENMPHKLRHSLTRHDVRTVEEIGWAGVQNGDLLRIAEQAGFDVMITGDQNLTFQQNLKGRKMALIGAFHKQLEHSQRRPPTALAR